MRKLIPSFTLALLGTTSAAPCTVPTTQQSLKGPVSTTYQIVMKDRTIAGQTIKGKTTVQTTTLKSIPNGVQMTMTENGKTNVMKTTCENGKTKMEINGKPMPTEVENMSNSKDVQAAGESMKEMADLKLPSRKIGEVWGGKMNTMNTKEVTSESTYQYKLLGMEKITTPAGTFDTYKVQLSMTMKMTFKNMPKDIKMPGMDKPTTTTTTTWYNRDNPNMIVKFVTNDMTMTLLKYQK